MTRGGGAETGPHWAIGWSLVALAVLAALAGRVGALSHADLTVWADRDLWRAWTLTRDWPVLGPEANGGARAPGGAFYWLLAALMGHGAGLSGVEAGLVGLFLLALIVVARLAGLGRGCGAAGLAAMAFAGSGVLAESATVWNPGFVVGFAAAATALGVAFLRTGRPLALGGTLAALALGAQIHMQMLELGLGLGLAVLAVRPRLDWRHGVAAAAGVGLPYVPFLLTSGGAVLAQAWAAPGAAWTNYVAWHGLTGTKAFLLLTLLGGAGDAFALASRGQDGGIALALLATDVLVAGLTVAGAVAAARRRGPDLALAAIVLVFGVVALMSDVNARHLVAAVPAVAVLSGRAAARLCGWLDGTGWRGRVGIGALVALLVARPLALAGVEFLPAPFSLLSVAAQREIAGTAKGLGLEDRAAFEDRAALFRLDARRGWMLVGEGIAGPMAFLLATTPAVPVASEAPTLPMTSEAPTLPAGLPSPACLAILTLPGEGGTLDPAALIRSPALASLRPALVGTAAHSAHFLYVFYVTAEGNCLKSFPNAYIADSGDAGAGRAILPVPRAPWPDDPVRVELDRAADGRWRAALRGRVLRGYTGLEFQTIVGAALCLSGPDGEMRRVSFGSLPVGSPQHGTLAPWGSAPFDMPAGRYRAWLVGRDGRRPTALAFDLGWVTLPALTVSPVVGSDAPPPAACGVGGP